MSKECIDVCVYIYIYFRVPSFRLFLPPSQQTFDVGASFCTCDFRVKVNFSYFEIIPVVCLSLGCHCVESESGISVIQAYVTIIQRHINVFLPYYLAHLAYFSQVELLFNPNVWVVNLVVKTAIICQNVAVVVIIIYIYIYLYIFINPFTWAGCDTRSIYP